MKYVVVVMPLAMVAIAGAGAVQVVTCATRSSQANLRLSRNASSPLDAMRWNAMRRVRRCLTCGR